LRYTRERVEEQFNDPESVFILAETEGSIVGSIFTTVSSSIMTEQYTDNQKFIIIDTVGKFSAVSVPKLWGKRGIGKKLVRAAEEYTLEVAERKLDEERKSGGIRYKLIVDMEMGVINLRRDLFPW
jgi:hypothetical protein